MDKSPENHELHLLLKRQIKRHLKITEDIPADMLSFLEAIDQAYRDFDSDIQKQDRIIELSSNELFQANTELHGVLSALPDILFRLKSDDTLANIRQNRDDHSLNSLSKLVEAPTIENPDSFANRFWDAVHSVRRTKVTETFEFEDVFEAGSKHLETRLVPFLDNDIIGIVRDITGEKQAQIERLFAEERLRWQAFHDTLTGLPNRAFFQQCLEEAIEDARHKNQRLAILFVDLDRFKNVNDTLGHAVGDELLRCVSERLASVMDSRMLLSRMGGDEFTVVIPNLADDLETQSIARAMLDKLEEPFNLSGREVFIAGSVGVSVFPDNGDSYESLLQHADIAMYTVKGAGGNSIRNYSSVMHKRIEERVKLENELRQGLERGELVLHYQPQVDLLTNTIVGVEALVRWNHPTLGLVPPNTFIPIAEETGLILKLGEWVLVEACRQAREWEIQGRSLRVAVNVFARQFEQPGFPSEVLAVLNLTGLSANLLDLELTESALIRNADAVCETLSAIRELSVHTSLDDFGTGYSSLSYLRRLPIDMLKIDRSFVKELFDGGASDRFGDLFLGDSAIYWSPEAKIIHAVIEVAHALNLVTIAEGVETEYQRDALLNLGCDMMQGFLYSKPLPVAELEKLLEANNSPVQMAA